jgi:predicted nucleic acid-binding protein
VGPRAKVNPYWLDTSLLLRLLTGDPPPLAEKALRVFREAEEGRLFLRVHPLVVAEAFYTLVSYYRANRKEAAETLLALLDRPGVEVEEGEAVTRALQEAGQGKLSFVDAFLLHRAEASGEGLATLDGALRRRAKGKVTP